MEWLGKAPMVLAVTREINTPRLTTIMGVMKAKKKPYEMFTSEDLALDEAHIGIAGSPTQPGGIFSPDMSRKCEIIKGSKEELVQVLFDKLRANGVNLDSYNIGCEMGAIK